MHRTTSMRPWGRSNAAPADQNAPPVPPVPQRAPDSSSIVADYVLNDGGDRLAEQWVNPHVAAYHAARGNRSTLRVSDAPPPTPTTPTNPNNLRTMNAEQRAAYIAQRDAENAAAAGAEAHPTVEPLNLVRVAVTAPPGKGAAAAVSVRPAALDVPVTPEPNSSGQENAASSGDEHYNPSSNEPFPYRRPSTLPPMSRLPTPPPRAPTPTPVTPPGSPDRASRRLASALSLTSPRRRGSVALRPDMEIEVRGTGPNRVVTIRFGVPPSGANGATPTT